MLAVMRSVFLHGGDAAIAASRGEGKTTLAERLLIKYVLTGELNFVVLFAATGSMAANSLDSIKTELETNDYLLADYPEVCAPVRALESTPNRAHYQIVTGKRFDDGKPYGPVSSKFSWCGQEIHSPNVPGSPSAAAIIATRGLDAAVRGLKIDGKRPQVAVIDDPDTQETCDSDEQAGKLEDRIESGISMLGGQRQAIARVMLCTVKNRRCVAFKFTDPSQKPTWKGRRFRFLLRPPTAVDRWTEYMELRRLDLQSNDEFGRRAHAYYLAHREEMHAGAEIANPNRFDSRTLPDGSQLEISALQRYYNELVRIGESAVASELNNDPPDETASENIDLLPIRIQRQVSGFDRYEVPPGCSLVTCGIDLGKWVLHYALVAWRPDATGYVIDYGQHRTSGATTGSEQGLELVIHRAILELVEHLGARDYGVERGPTLIDASYQTSAVYSACLAAGAGVYPLMGFGRSHGCAGGAMFRPLQNSQLVRSFDGGRMKRLDKVWLVETDADKWKAWVHSRWLTAPGEPGCLYLYGQPGEPGGRLSNDERSHTDFANQICNETQAEEMIRGKLQTVWKVKGGQRPANHYLDCLCYSATAAGMKGIRLPIAVTGKTLPASLPRPVGERPPQRDIREMFRAAQRAVK